MVLGDAPLLAGEVVRLLAVDGVVLWSNRLGVDAPHHLPVATVLAALSRARGGDPWQAVTADAGWGLWALPRRG